MKFFPHAEGYVNVTETCGFLSSCGFAYNYVFNYTDHLGNIRLSYGIDPATSTLKIMEENHYYPFGLKHANYNSDELLYQKGTAGAVVLKGPTTTVESVYKFKFNGFELQDELGLNVYDYGARNYDPALGRWMNIDPLAETSRRFSPYTYALDNPVYFIDPDGMQADDWKKTKQGDYVYDAELTKENASTQLKEGESYVGESAVVISGHGRNSDGTVKDVETKHSLNADGSVTDLINIENVDAGESEVLTTGSVIYVNNDVDTSKNELLVDGMRSNEVENNTNKIENLNKTVDSLNNEILKSEVEEQKIIQSHAPMMGDPKTGLRASMIIKLTPLQRERDKNKKEASNKKNVIDSLNKVNKKLKDE